MRSKSAPSDSVAVAGGTYLEQCTEPLWLQFFGSGGRAAAVMSAMAGSTELHTFATTESRLAVESIAATFGFRVRVHPARQTYTFAYRNALATPAILPERPRGDLALIVKAPNVLRFGMLEGEAVVEAESAVYDPQNPTNPKPFRANGSKAGRLAVVLNRAEGGSLSRRKDPQEIGKRLLEVEDARVVVLKLGPDGAIVFERGRRKQVSAYCTPSVFPIGSGDVFSAVFAVEWMLRRRSAVDAAVAASRAAARYCDTRVLPLLPDDQSGPYQECRAAKTGVPKRRVYLAGPFFDYGQRLFIEEARRALAAQGLRVFSPFHDVGGGAANDVAPADLAALRKSDVVFALVDGLDAGTLFEIGYARALGKPVVALAERESGEVLKMVEGSGCHVVRDFVSGVYWTSWSSRQ